MTPVLGNQDAKPQPNINAPVHIEMAPSSAADDPSLVARLRDIVNLVYRETEGDIFIDGYQRVSTEEMQQTIRAGELAVAYLTSDPATLSSNVSTSPCSHRSSTVLGCMRVQKLPDGKTGEFGMFAIDPTHRGSGMGREMVAFAESYCLTTLGATAMRLELLWPQGFEHGFKKRLQAWYERMGYRLVKLGAFQEDYPQLAALLRGPCEYRVYEKSIV